MDRNKETDLSIIVPVYNGEKYIERLLTSIAETNPGDVYSYEIILVNDGSSDNSGRICRRFRERWPQVRYFEKSNEGIASARNVGLREARGTYITFADQDDIVVTVVPDLLQGLQNLFPAGKERIGIHGSDLGDG